MEQNLNFSQVDFLKNEISEEELKLKIQEIDQKIKKKVESILIKDDIDYADVQLLNSYRYDLKNKLETKYNEKTKDEYAELLSKMFSRRI